MRGECGTLLTFAFPLWGQGGFCLYQQPEWRNYKLIPRKVNCNIPLGFRSSIPLTAYTPPFRMEKLNLTEIQRLTHTLYCFQNSMTLLKMGHFPPSMFLHGSAMATCLSVGGTLPLVFTVTS